MEPTPPDMTRQTLREPLIAAHNPLAADPVRVPEPMSAAWQGVEYRVKHWDVHGFVLETAIPRVVAPGSGRIADFTLLIGRGATRIEMRVQARATQAEDQQPLRYGFVDLDRAQAEVLHRIVDHVVAHKAMSLTRLLNETEEVRVQRKETGERVRKLRSGFQLALAGVVLAGAASYAWTRLMTVPARYAAVTASATALSVPVAGVIASLPLRPGQVLSVGEVLGHVRPADHDAALRALADERAEAEAELALLTQRRAELQQLAAVAVAGNGQDRARLETMVSLARQRLSVEQEQLAHLRARGLPTAAREAQRATQQGIVLQAEAALLEAQGNLDRLARAEVLAPMGVLGADLRDSVPTLETADLRLAALETRLSRLAADEALNRDGMPILSPCDCTVQSIEHRVGEWAALDAPVALLTGGERLTVHALVLGESARSIELGDPAQATLADGTHIEGVVSRMAYQAHWPGYAGLNDNVFAADRYARIEVTPSQPLTAPVGMVADLSVSTGSLVSALSGFVGL